MTRKTASLASLLAASFLLSTALAHDPIRAEFTTEDGVKLVGEYWTPIGGRDIAPAIILLHMYGSDRTAWNRDIIVPLEYAGFAIMRIDLRGHGESTKPEEMNLAKRVADRDEELFGAMHKDVAAAIKWLEGRKEVDRTRIVLAGASVGCSVALDYAARDKSIKAVALLSPGAKYLGLDSIAHVKEYGPRPLLMLTAEQERVRGGFDTLVEEAKKAGALVTAEVFDQERIHGTNMFGKVDGVEDKIANFLKKSVTTTEGDR